MKNQIKKYIAVVIAFFVLVPQTMAQDTYEYYFPGYFMKDDKNSYDFVDEELIDQLRVALQFKSTPSSGIINFGKSGHTDAARAARHEAARQFVIAFNNRFQSEERRDRAQRAVHDPDVKKVFIEAGWAISLREWEKRERNPRNFQGIWQVYWLEQIRWSKCFEPEFITRWWKKVYRASVFSCSEVQDIYTPFKMLTQEERLMHTIDFFSELLWKFGGMDKTRLNNTKSPYWYYENINIWLNAIFRNKWYSSNDINKITLAIINNEQQTLISFLSREQEILSTIWIRAPADFEKLKDYVKWWVIWALYNWAGNNYGFSKNGRLRNVLDHQYVSNLPNHGFRFVGIRADGGAVDWNKPDANPWVIPAILSEYPDGEQRMTEFLALLIYLRNAWELKMSYHGNKL